ncbi:hypothetical protein IJI28_01580 [Candidatus Saccharibacteria bacterium]|nr:hypothetical protein [Candidatus Saccharibacteria bacterium]
MNMVKKNTYTLQKRSAMRKRNDNIVVRRVVLTVIGVAVAVVVAGVIYSLVWSPEKATKAKLDEMAREYYEGFTYENLINGAMSQEEIEGVMDKYKVRGFAPVYLRQLLLYNDRENMKEAGFVKNYCDENLTYVKIYPEAPYDKKSYRVEYNYTCEW